MFYNKFEIVRFMKSTTFFGSGPKCTMIQYEVNLNKFSTKIAKHCQLLKFIQKRVDTNIEIINKVEKILKCIVGKFLPILIKLFYSV